MSDSKKKAPTAPAKKKAAAKKKAPPAKPPKLQKAHWDAEKKHVAATFLMGKTCGIVPIDRPDLAQLLEALPITAITSEDDLEALQATINLLRS